jgi:hypothetical protein
VSLLKTLEAPITIASYTDNVSLLHRRVLNSIGTTRRWTPFSLAIDLNERLLEVVLVLHESGLVAQLLEEVLRHD